MHSDDLLAILGAHQARIVAQIDTAKSLLRLGPVAARAPLARSRWTMIRLMREYQLFKHHEIFDRVATGGDEAQAADARHLKAECAAFNARFAAHVAHWSAADLAAQWHEYRTAMRSMAAALQTRLADERREIAALVGGGSSVRRPPATWRGRSPPAARADSRAR